MLDLIVLHGEFSLFTVRGNFWYQIYRNRRKKVLCSRLSLITLTTMKSFGLAGTNPCFGVCPLNSLAQVRIAGFKLRKSQWSAIGL